jgi:glycosyltransferase involved in cell wall biosynthesis
MPRISVLMPAHNAGPYIRKAVKSALKSLPKDAEVVVLDDASSDNTFEAASRVRDRRVRVLAAEHNLGSPAAMRSLMAQTDSEFVARLDADDLAVPRRFVLQQQELEAGADVCFGKMLFFGKGYTGPKIQKSARLSVDEAALALLIGCPLGHSTMFGRRSAFGENSYPECPADDYATWLDMAARGQRVVMSDRPMARYRQHGGQLTQNAEWREKRAKNTEPVRTAYNALSQRVLDITPAATHPIWGSWAAEVGGDQAVVDAIVARVNALEGEPRTHLTTMLGWHGLADRVEQHG